MPDPVAAVLAFESAPPAERLRFRDDATARKARANVHAARAVAVERRAAVNAYLGPIFEEFLAAPSGTFPLEERREAAHVAHDLPRRGPGTDPAMCAEFDLAFEEILLLVLAVKEFPLLVPRADRSRELLAAMLSVDSLSFEVRQCSRP